MASKTLKEFAKNMIFLPKETQDLCLAKWERTTIEAVDIAKRASPLLTGDLQGSGVHRKAKVTINGINSAIIFKQPYAEALEAGKRTLKSGRVVKLKISKKINPNAKKGYVSSAVKEIAPDFIEDLKDCIGKAFLRA